MKVDSAVWEGGFLKLHTADVDARHFAYVFTPGEYEINVKKSLRSLDANAYAWALIDKLAKATGVPASEVYRRAVRDVGGNMKIGCGRAAASLGIKRPRLAIRCHSVQDPRLRECDPLLRLFGLFQLHDEPPYRQLDSGCEIRRHRDHAAGQARRPFGGMGGKT